MVEAEPITVRTLIGAKAFATSLICLDSLVKQSKNRVKLVIHEDGTIDEKHREQLRCLDPEVGFVSRVDADQVVESYLARYPRCLAFRRSEVLALKLFDISVIEDGPVAYCDSDVFFFQSYTGLFSNSRAPSLPVFMTDVVDAYAIRPWNLWPVGSIRLVSRLNTGIIVVPPGYLDLDFLEWFLSKLSGTAVFGRRRYWTEQTCWAGLAARSGALLLNPKQFVVATATRNLCSADTVAIHFVSTYRCRLQEVVNEHLPLNGPPRTSSVEAAMPLLPPRMLFADLRRRFLAAR